MKKLILLFLLLVNINILCCYGNNNYIVLGKATKYSVIYTDKIYILRVKDTKSNENRELVVTQKEFESTSIGKIFKCRY